MITQLADQLLVEYVQTGSLDKHHAVGRCTPAILANERLTFLGLLMLAFFPVFTSFSSLTPFFIYYFFF